MTAGAARHNHDRPLHGVSSKNPNTEIVALMRAALASVGDLGFGITRASSALAFAEIVALMRAAPA
jgi:hypothetical protein